ncbi:MAG: hypothetical protein Q9O62_05995 [Ardenticatenia bacterium]|nr:hypothetical protein [Ardenticatenia bacterium]
MTLERRTRRAVEALRERGYWVDMFPEFAPELYGYRADAFLSIHVDSCVDWQGTTGFKAARASNSAIPTIEDQFLACLYDRYAAVTGLEPHDGSITHNMRGYHAFYKVDPSTPALIVEIGFLYYDREMLTEQPERVARGLVESVECFLATQGKQLSKLSPTSAPGEMSTPERGEVESRYVRPPSPSRSP